MKNNYRRLLKVFLLFAFVSLMLCPYAEIITASHGGKLLIHQDDFRKANKLVKVDSHLSENLVFIRNNSLLFISSDLKDKQQAVGVPHHSIVLTFISTVQLLL
jgi:hypothetical protein